MVNIVLSFEDNYIIKLYFNKKKDFNMERWTVFRNKTLKSLYNVLAIHQLHSITIYHKRRGRGRDHMVVEFITTKAISIYNH